MASVRRCVGAAGCAAGPGGAQLVPDASDVAGAKSAPVDLDGSSAADVARRDLKPFCYLIQVAIAYTCT